MGAPLDQLIHDATRGLADAPPGTRLIPLTKGFFCVVDEADFDLVGDIKWCAFVNRSNVYAGRGLYLGNYRSKYVGMHRLILGAVDGVMVDHISRNGLDNRRVNLRVATHTQNMRNRRKPISGVRSQYKGVNPIKGRFQARIGSHGRTINLGCFSTEIEAAIAYDRAAKRLYGEFCNPNFPDHQHLLSDAKNVGEGLAL